MFTCICVIVHVLICSCAHVYIQTYVQMGTLLCAKQSTQTITPPPPTTANGQSFASYIKWAIKSVGVGDSAETQRKPWLPMMSSSFELIVWVCVLLWLRCAVLSTELWLPVRHLLVRVLWESADRVRRWQWWGGGPGGLQLPPCVKVAVVVDPLDSLQTTSPMRLRN